MFVAGQNLLVVVMKLHFKIYAFQLFFSPK